MTTREIIAWSLAAVCFVLCGLSAACYAARSFRDGNGWRTSAIVFGLVALCLALGIIFFQ